MLKRILTVTTLLTLPLTALADGSPAHWEYTGEDGPSHWATLDSHYESCGKGQHQSPINITQAVKSTLPALEFHYSDSSPTIINNGHTVQVNLPAGNTLTVGDQTYELVQFHFHTPSEEAINGKHTAMVAHFVHKNAAGALGVVAVLLQVGKANSAFGPIFEHLPRPHEKISVDDLMLKLADLLPKNLGYYAFEGSLTTPPCSEGVSWMVLKEPVTLSAGQIKAFRQVIHANARPIQPLNDRVIKESM